MMNQELSFHLWIDSVCDRFESEFQTCGKWPEIDAFVADCLKQLGSNDQGWSESDSILQPDSPTVYDDQENRLLIELFKLQLTHDQQSSNVTIPVDARTLAEQYPHHKSTIELVLSAISNSENSGLPLAVNLIRSQTIDAQSDNFAHAQKIGNYILQHHLGQGGMGTVWAARQIHPVQRDVAIKFMRQRIVGPQALIRFRVEQQALAILDDPGIAKIFAADETENHQPFFVMELISGMPITQFAEEHSLSLRQRLELMVVVSTAVTHAHQKGIIHRDLKPKNILVQVSGQQFQPKIIDFGLAKATSQSLTDDSMHTAQGQILGTPDYMSPEQTRFDNRDIDVRTDVYALGAVSYELLTGLRPFENQKLKERSLDETLAIIRETDPIPPSQRNREPPNTNDRFNFNVPRELDWIVMRSLEKDRNRRYNSAQELAQDLQRFLNGDPIDAAPRSKIYQFKKFVQRHRTGVLASAVSFLFLVAGLIGTGLALNWAILAQKESAQQAEDLSLALADLKKSREATEARSNELTKITKFQQRQIEQLDPGSTAIQLRSNLLDAFRLAQRRGEGIAPTINEIDSVKRFDEALSSVNFVDLSLAILQTSVFEPTLVAIRNDYLDQPLLQARLLATAAGSLSKVGLPILAESAQQEAVDIFRIELTNDNEELIGALSELAQLKGNISKSEDSNALVIEAKRLSDQLADDSPVALVVRAQYAGIVGWTYLDFSKSFLLYREALADSIRIHGELHQTTIDIKSKLGAILHRSRKYREAISLYREVVRDQRKLGNDDPRLLIRSLTNLADALSAVEPTIRSDEAWDLHKEAYFLAEDSLGRIHPKTINALHSLGAFEGYFVNYDDGEKLLLDAMERCRVVYGNVNDQIIGVKNSLSGVYWLAKRHTKGIELLKSQIEDSQLRGPDSRETDQYRVFLARSYNSAGLRAEAIEQVMLAKQLWKGETADPVIMNYVIQILMDAEQNDEAIEVAREYVELVNKTSHASAMDRCADLRAGWKWLLKLNQFSEAEPILRECVEIQQREVPAQWRTLETEFHLGICLQRLNKIAESEKTITLAHEKMSELFDRFSDSERLGIVKAYIKLELTELAISLGNAKVELARDMFPLKTMERFDALKIGWVWLMNLKQFAAAESAIKECVEIHEELKPDHWRTFDLNAQYGECLTEQGRPQEAMPFLIRGYEGLLARKDSIPPNMKRKIGYAMDRIVTCYQKLGDSENASAWQEKLDTFNKTHD